LLESIAAVLSRSQTSAAFTPESLLHLLRGSLVGDEQFTVIIDGLDWLEDAPRVVEQLLQIGAEVEHLPIRTLVSCRMTYWSRLRAAFDSRVDVRVVESALDDFTEEELKGRHFGPQSRFDLYNHMARSSLLRNPIIFGFARDEARRHTLGTDFVSPNVIKAFEHYVAGIIMEAELRSQVEFWWTKAAIEAVTKVVLNSYSNNSSSKGQKGLVTRGDLRRLLESETGEYHPKTLDVMTSAGLFMQALWYFPG